MNTHSGVKIEACTPLYFDRTSMTGKMWLYHCFPKAAFFSCAHQHGRSSHICLVQTQWGGHNLSTEIIEIFHKLVATLLNNLTAKSWATFSVLITRVITRRRGLLMLLWTGASWVHPRCKSLTRLSSASPSFRRTWTWLRNNTEDAHHHHNTAPWG